jgi:YjbR
MCGELGKRDRTHLAVKVRALQPGNPKVGAAVQSTRSAEIDAAVPAHGSPRSCIAGFSGSGKLRRATGTPSSLTTRYCRPVSGPGDVPSEILDRLRSICRRLPETYEEPAWIGLRWRIRTRTFAHVYTPDPQRYPFYARHLGGGEAPTVMTFRVPTDDLLGLTAGGFPFFRAEWGRNVVGTVLGDHADWTEIAELITDSYCEMAPKFLVARVASPRRAADP